jgi:hypothetical protein
MKTGTYNTRLNIVGIIWLFIATLCLTTSCTDEEIIQDEQTSTSTSTNRDDGIPMVFDVMINDYDGVTSSRAISWPDGATLIIRPSGTSKLLKSGCSCIFAVYYSEIGWVAYNLNNKLNSDDEVIWGTDSTTIRYLDSYKYDYSNTVRESIAATCALYVGTVDSYGYYISKGKFSLRANIEPKLGRVRFKGNPSADVLYNHAQYSIYYAGGNLISLYIHRIEYGSSHGVLSFAKNSDGEYYSNYLYTDVIPDLKIGDYVYRYKGSLILTSGKSGVIDLPAEDNYSTNWIREPYFEETKNIEVTLANLGSYYNIYAQKYSDTVYEDSNTIESLVGLNMEVKCTPKSGQYGIGLDIYSDNGFTFPYSGWWYSSQNIESRHLCGGNKYYPTIELNTSKNIGATIHSIKISNF